MRKLGIATIVLLLSFWVKIGFAAAPHSIGGFRLGAPVADYLSKLEMDTATSVRHRPYLTVVDIKPVEGFKSGYILFGNCTQPNRIVRIRLKYADPSKEFFEELLRRFTSRFGEPTQYRGDAFQAFISWKWSFRDKQGKRISLFLQHYNGPSDDYPRGNTVKITLTSMLEKERQCYQKIHKKEITNRRAMEKAVQRPITEVDFDRFIPK